LWGNIKGWGTITMKALVLWGDDHEERAKELAVAYAAETRGASQSPKKVSGLTRLSYWGHGTPAKFCEMSDLEFAERLLDWKKKNSDLDSVEILTCNGRFSGDGRQSYVDKVRSLLLQPKYAALNQLKFRALPAGTTPSGKTCHYSILNRDTTTKSWSYVAAPGYFSGSSTQTDMHMFAARQLLNELLQTPTGRQGYVQAYVQMMGMKALTLDHPYAVFKKMDQKKVDSFNTRMKAAKEDAYILVGASTSTLAWHLHDVK
jgi:hypothetical protein